MNIIANAQIVVTEVMFDPLESERSDEFVEIFNAGNTAIDLTEWQVGDGASYDIFQDVDGNGLRIQARQYAVILDPNYFSDSSSVYNSLIPGNALVLTIDGATFGSNGLSNSTAETVTLINAQKDTVQRYTYSLNNAPGFSDEKIDPFAGNDILNWGNSRSLHGTPGRRNSLTPGEFDLATTRFSITSGSLEIGVPITFTVIVKNVGKQAINGFDMLTFYDQNKNRHPESNEILSRQTQPLTLASDDSAIVNGVFDNPPFGEIDLGVASAASVDEDTSNNVITRTVFVDDPSGIDLVLNEIMFEPETGREEWVEIFNDGDTEVNLRNVFFSDARDTVQISGDDRFIQPGEFLVLGGDDIIATQYGVAPAQLIVQRKFPNLNNDTDDLRLLGPSFAVYDHVNYTDEWYGRNVARGTSLEKINPSFDGQFAQNWAASVAASGSTPGEKNTINIDVQQSESALEIKPNPFSPDSDGFEDFAVIRFTLEVETAFVNLRIFDLRGRLIRFLANGVPVAPQGQFVWDGKDDDGRIARIGAYIGYFQALNTERRVSQEFKKTIILMKK